MLLYDGKYLNYSKCNVILEGQFSRVDLRPITNLLGKNIAKFEMKNGYGIAYIK